MLQTRINWQVGACFCCAGLWIKKLLNLTIKAHVKNIEWIGISSKKEKNISYFCAQITCKNQLFNYVENLNSLITTRSILKLNILQSRYWRSINVHDKFLFFHQQYWWTYVQCFYCRWSKTRNLQPTSSGIYWLRNSMERRSWKCDIQDVWAKTKQICFSV